MVHQLAEHYKWSKSQINEVYPDEASVLLKFIAHERQDKTLQTKIDYYTRFLDDLYVHHGIVEEQRDRARGLIEKLQNLKITILKNSDDPEFENDEDFPDLEKLHQLKAFRQAQSLK